MTFRDASLWFHRYTGLAMAVFLIVTSITGVFLTFNESLDNWFNRDYLQVEVIPDTTQQPITKLYQVVQAEYPQAEFSTLPLQPIAKDKAVSFRVDRARRGEKKQPSVDFQTVYINPYTAEIIATRNHQQWAWRNTMNKVFLLHRNLLLGDWGRLLLGIVALLWTINCFIGVYLTFPRALRSRKKGKAPGKKRRASAFRRWLPAWTIRRTKNVFKLSFDAHHALSLWLWGMMFVLAWSSVGFNLHSVYKPVMNMVFASAESDANPDPSKSNPKAATNAKPSAKQQANSERGKNKAANEVNTEPQNQLRLANSKPPKDNKANNNRPLTVSMAEIQTLKQMAQHSAKAKGVTISEFSSYNVDKVSGNKTLRFKTNLDTVGRGSSLAIKGEKEAALKTSNLNLASKAEVKWGFERSTQDSVSMWLVFLHRGFVWGTPYKIFLSLVGIATAVVSGTGVYLWWRGRQARKKKKLRQQKAKNRVSL